MGHRVKIEQAVTFNLECAHLSEGDPRLHGHSYVVEVWTDHIRDLPSFEAAIAPVRNAVDHSMLNESIGGTTMEHLAGWLLEKLAFVKPTAVVVRRPTLGYVVRATR